MPPVRDLPPGWARVADAAAIALLLLALGVAIAGGFVLSPADMLISVRSAWRPLAWAAAILTVRHLLVRRPGIHRWIAGSLLRASRRAGPLPQDPIADGLDRVHPARRLLTQTIAIVALYAAVTVVMTYPQIVRLQWLNFDPGDQLFSIWRLAWVAHQLPRDPGHLFDGNIFYPERYTLAYSDSMIVPALLAAPLFWLGVPPVIAYNLIFLSAFALSGAGMFVLVRALTRHTGAAFIAGLAFAFLPYRSVHYPHLELQMAQWMPLCLWALHRTVAQARLRDGLLTGLFAALQTLSSWYYGIFFATYLVPVGAILLIGAEQRVRVLRALGAGALLALILVAPFARPYFEARRTVGERDVADMRFYSATPRNYLTAHPSNVTYGRVLATGGAAERELFQGLAVLVIALVGLWPPLSAARMAYAVGLALAFEISLGFNGVIFPWLHAYVLPYRGLRAPARMAILVGLSVAVLVGYGVARLCRQVRGRPASIAVGVVLAMIVVVEYRSRPVLKAMWTTPPAIYSRLVPETAIVLDLPLLRPNIALEPVYMYFSTFSWHTLVNGYSGFSPPSYESLVDLIPAFPDDDTIAALRRRGVTHIVVHGAFYPPATYDEVIARLDRRPELTLLTTAQWRQRPTRLYRLAPASGP